MASNVNDKVSSSIYCQACGAANPVQATRCFACRQPLSHITGGSGAATNPLTGSLLLDTIIQQRYRILGVLNTGAVSTVYKAQDIQLGNRMVALKEIGLNNSGTQEASEMIEVSKREMLLLAGLIHPNLPRIYDYFVENQRWYFVMDFLAGETLEAYVRKRKYPPLPVEEVFDIGIQLATVLDYLHLHQPPLGFDDLTLHNIWRTPDGKLYLLDIGTATPAATVSERNNSISSLGRILRQLQAGKMFVRSRPRVPLPRLRKQPRNAKHPQSSPLKVLIRQMVHKDAGKGLYTMGMVKEELQHLAAQHSPLQKRLLSRRTLLKMGGLAGLAAASSGLTWFVEHQMQPNWPRPGYSPKLGGTIYTYDSPNGILAVAWSPDGTRIAMGDGNGRVQAWDANTGQHVINYHDSDSSRVEAVIWLPDGKSIVAGDDDSVVWIWNAATGKMRSVYHGHTDWVITLACSPDGRYIASGSNDQTVQVWEAATGRQVVIYRGHSGGIGSVAWSPDGRYIASASFDHTVQVWEVVTGRRVFTYLGHADMVYTVAWSPDGQRVASGGKDHTVQIWPVALFESAGQPQESTIFIYRGLTASVQAVAWSPDSSTIASAANNVQLWNGLTGQHIFTYTKNTVSSSLEVQAVAWSPNGRYIASGGGDSTVQVWNAR